MKSLRLGPDGTATLRRCLEMDRFGAPLLDVARHSLLCSVPARFSLAKPLWLVMRLVQVRNGDVAGLRTVGLSTTPRLPPGNGPAKLRSDALPRSSTCSSHAEVLTRHQLAEG